MAQNKRLTKEEIQDDKFIDFVLQSYTLLKDNIKTISITLALLIVGVVAYLTYTQNQEKNYAEASANFNAAIEISKEAQTNFLDTTPAEENENDADDTDETEETSFKDSEEKLKSFFEKYPNVTFADKARFNYAKNLYYQEKYPEARAEFQKVIETHKPENAIYALYSQKAVGNCYEQEGNYEKAISAYEEREFPAAPEVQTEIRQYVLSNAKYNQALCYEKVNSLEDAKAAYQEIMDEFKQTLEIGILKKSQDVIKTAKEVLTVIEDPPDLSRAEQLESEQLYYQSLVEYTDSISTYKVQKDIEGGLPKEVRKRIRNYEDMATTLIKNLRSARRNEETGSLSSALSFYGEVVKFDKFGLSRDLYERAMLNYDRLSTNDTGGPNE